MGAGGSLNILLFIKTIDSREVLFDYLSVLLNMLGSFQVTKSDDFFSSEIFFMTQYDEGSNRVASSAALRLSATQGYHFSSVFI